MSLMQLFALITIGAVAFGVAYSLKLKGERQSNDSGQTGQQGIEYEPASQRQTTGRVVITDIKMPFDSMVIFMIKWALAAIPAAIILGLIGFVVLGVLGRA